MPEIKEGQPYRVTFEGVGKNKGVRVESINGSGDTHLYPYTLENALKVEQIESVYATGGLYRDFCGDTYRYNGGDWTLIYRTPTTCRRGEIGHHVGNDVPKRPLRKLVPESR